LDMPIAGSNTVATSGNANAAFTETGFGVFGSPRTSSLFQLPVTAIGPFSSLP
jgi:hypothetical protein